LFVGFDWCTFLLWYHIISEIIPRKVESWNHGYWPLISSISDITSLDKDKKISWFRQIVWWMRQYIANKIRIHSWSVYREIWECTYKFCTIPYQNSIILECHFWCLQINRNLPKAESIFSDKWYHILSCFQTYKPHCQEFTSLCLDFSLYKTFFQSKCRCY